MDGRKGKGTERAGDGEAVSIGPALRHAEQRAVAAVVHIHHTPIRFEAIAVRAPETGRTAVIHVQHSKPARRPVSVTAQHIRSQHNTNNASAAAQSA
jgi:hypothetical protein